MRRNKLIAESRYWHRQAISRINVNQIDPPCSASVPHPPVSRSPPPPPPAAAPPPPPPPHSTLQFFSAFRFPFLFSLFSLFPSSPLNFRSLRFLSLPLPLVATLLFSLRTLLLHLPFPLLLLPPFFLLLLLLLPIPILAQAPFISTPCHCCCPNDWSLSTIFPHRSLSQICRSSENQSHLMTHYAIVLCVSKRVGEAVKRWSPKTIRQRLCRQTPDPLGFI